MRRGSSGVLLVPFVLLIGALTVHEVARGGILTSDTISLLQGVARTDTCLHAVEFHCGSAVDKWPLLQYIPALILKRLGTSFAGTENGLVLLNGAAALGTLALVWVAVRRLAAGLAPLALLAMLVSPLPWYATTGFGESLAAFLTTLTIVGVLLRWPAPLIAAACFGAVISKETAFPFILIFSAAALLLVPGRYRRRLAVALASGLIVGIGATAAFNLFRFDSPLNQEYVRAGYTLHGLLWRADFFGGSLAAPNAGLIFFWPLGLAIVAVSVWHALPLVRRLRSLREREWSLLLTAGGFVVLLATLVSWWQPFGWEAYGPRLIVPWLPSVLVLALAADEQLQDRLVMASRSVGALVAVGAVALVLGLPEIGAFLQPERPLATFAQHVDCKAPPNFLDLIRANDPVAHRIHNECTSRFMWRHDPMLLEAVKSITGLGWIVAALFSASVAALMAFARAATPRGTMSRPLKHL